MWEILIILFVFIAFAAVSERLRLGTVLGFLLGGALIGPSGLGVVHELEAARELADLGVVFLLFNLGLELKIERLRLIGTRVYVLALTQLLVTAGAIASIAHGFGVGIEGAIVVGGALALSSTAVVLRVLRDLGRTLTQLGRVAIAILLVQDIAVGPLLVLTKALGPGTGSLATAMLLALGKGVLVLLVVVLLARFALRPVLAFLAALDADEVFTAMTLLLVLGASFATEQAGLSMALGAFVAGLMVADTEYRHQIAADIGRFRGLLLGFFFMTVGMTVDAGFAIRHAGAVVAIAAGLLLLKALLLFGLAIALGFRPPAGRRARRAAVPGQRIRLRPAGAGDGQWPARRRNRAGGDHRHRALDGRDRGRGVTRSRRAEPPGRRGQPPRCRNWRRRPEPRATTSWWWASARSAWR